MSYLIFLLPMLPKNSKHSILPTAEKLNVDRQLVEDVVSFYYSTLRKTLVDLKHYNIQVEDLGMFKVKSGELPKLYAKYTEQLRTDKKETYIQGEVRKDITARLEKVKAVQNMMRDTKERKKQFFENKRKNDECTE